MFLYPDIGIYEDGMEDMRLLTSPNLGDVHKLFENSRHMKGKQESVKHFPDFAEEFW
jgi:hypothetical protein